MTLWQVVSSLSATAIAQIAGSRKQPRLHSYDIKAVYPHNPNAFTQGLEYEKLCSPTGNCTDILWESTGETAACSASSSQTIFTWSNDYMIHQVGAKTQDPTDLVRLPIVHFMTANLTIRHFGQPLFDWSDSDQTQWCVGMNGESEVRMTNLTDGKLIKKKRLALQDFGEGLVRSQDRCAFTMGITVQRTRRSTICSGF